MRFPRSFIDEVRRSSDPLGIIGEVVALKRRGSRFVGICPFHDEKTPSFTVNEEGLWYCFGCGTGGDLFRFIMEQEAVGFGDAVRIVAERVGMPLPAPETLPTESGRRNLPISRPRLLAALTAADAFYRQQLADAGGARAREFLRERGFDREVVDTFGLGYAPESWEALRSQLRKAGFSEAEAEAAGLLKRRQGSSGSYDRMRHRVVFPIRDLRGRTIAFGGRIIDTGEPKYLNSPETPLFQKSKTLYGLPEGREEIGRRGFALLVEGYFDLLSCAQYGFRNAIAPLGTSFTEDHARLLSRFTRKAVVSFDGDVAGLAAAERTVGMFLSQGFQVTVVQLPAGHDPDSYLRAEGAGAYGAALRSSQAALEFLVLRAGERADLGTPRGKAEALASLLEFVVPIADRVERAEWIGRLAQRLQVQEHLVEQAAAEALSRRRRRGRSGSPRSMDGSKSRGDDAGGWKAQLGKPKLAERELLRAVLEYPEWRRPLEEICRLEAIRDPRIRALLAAAARCEQDGLPPHPAELLARCKVPGADVLLSRLRLQEGAPMDWDTARNCALGIHDASLERKMRKMQEAIEEALKVGDRERFSDLNREKILLARQIRSM
ncbi:MAG: DNA primase [Acidobacteriota bacterium]